MKTRLLAAVSTLALALGSAPVSADETSLYIGAGAGLNFLNDLDLSAGGDVDTDLGWAGIGALGFRFGNVAYCTDTNGIPAESRALLDGLDVLVLDALRAKPHPTHYSIDEAVAVARQLQPKQTYFTHMCHELEHEATTAALPAGMALAHDGLRIELT